MLEKVELRDKYESVIWTFLSTTVSDSVLEYQVEAQQRMQSLSTPATPFSPEELGDLLVNAVKTMRPTEVCTSNAACNQHIQNHVIGFRYYFSLNFRSFPS